MGLHKTFLTTGSRVFRPELFSLSSSSGDSSLVCCGKSFGLRRDLHVFADWTLRAFPCAVDANYVVGAIGGGVPRIFVDVALQAFSFCSVSAPHGSVTTWDGLQLLASSFSLEYFKECVILIAKNAQSCRQLMNRAACLVYLVALQ